MTPYVINKAVEHGDESVLVDELLASYPNLDAIFASGNTLSQIVYKKVLDKGIKVPEQMQIISYDGVFNTWNKEAVITSIQQPIKVMAEEAFKLLIKTINEEVVENKHIYPTQFIKANTTK